MNEASCTSFKELYTEREEERLGEFEKTDDREGKKDTWVWGEEKKKAGRRWSGGCWEDEKTSKLGIEKKEKINQMPRANWERRKN